METIAAESLNYRLRNCTCTMCTRLYYPNRNVPFERKCTRHGFPSIDVDRSTDSIQSERTNFCRNDKNRFAFGGALRRSRKKWKHLHFEEAMTMPMTTKPRAINYFICKFSLPLQANERSLNEAVWGNRNVLMKKAPSFFSIQPHINV